MDNYFEQTWVLKHNLISVDLVFRKPLNCSGIPTNFQPQLYSTHCKRILETRFRIAEQIFNVLYIYLIFKLEQN